MAKFLQREEYSFPALIRVFADFCFQSHDSSGSSQKLRRLKTLEWDNVASAEGAA